MLAIGLGMFNSTNSVFVKPVCESLGLARGEFTFHRTIIFLVSAFLLPLYGRIIETIGVKKVMLIGIIGLGAVAFGYSLSTKLIHFYILAFFNGIFFNGLHFMSVGVLINNWFHGKKGLAMGLAYAGSGWGAALMIPVISQIIETSGWQHAYQFMAVFGVVLLLPIISILVRNKPEDMGLKAMPLSQTAHARGDNLVYSSLTLHEALKTNRFWMLLIAFFLINFFAGATNTHSAPYLSDIGYTAAYASAVISLFMIFLTVGKIILGMIYDRFGALPGNIFISVFALGFPILALLSRIPVMAWSYAVCIGIASCAVSVPIPILIMRHCGEKDFPRIFSFCSMVSAFGGSISVPAMGAIFDHTGSYNLAWVIFQALSVVIAICLIGVEVLGKKSIHTEC